jgi:hypothetical protein
MELSYCYQFEEVTRVILVPSLMGCIPDPRSWEITEVAIKAFIMLVGSMVMTHLLSECISASFHQRAHIP